MDWVFQRSVVLRRTLFCFWMRTLAVPLFIHKSYEQQTIIQDRTQNTKVNRIIHVIFVPCTASAKKPLLTRLDSHFFFLIGRFSCYQWEISSSSTSSMAKRQERTRNEEVIRVPKTSSRAPEETGDSKRLENDTGISSCCNSQWWGGWLGNDSKPTFMKNVRNRFIFPSRLSLHT